jgi:hypothetical protein
MKMKAIAIPMAAGLAAMVLGGCAAHLDTSKHTSGGQVVDLDARTRLLVSVSGVETQPAQAEFAGVPKSKDGEPIHRVLHGSDGTVLFAYDLAVRKAGTGGAYQLSLKPAGKGPTFDAAREVTVQGQEAVRVELMEEPGTSRKIEDIFRLVPADRTGEDLHANAFGAHMQMVHSFFHKLFQGD